MRVLKFIGRAFLSFFVGLLNFIVFIIKVEWRFVLRYIEMVNNYTGNGTLGMDGSSRETHWLIRYPIRFFLWLLSFPVMLLIPVGIITLTAAASIAIDQATYPSFPVADVFLDIDATPKDGKAPTVEDIGSALLTASYHQMEMELDSTFGWAPNDTMGLQFFDNRLHRQLGVRHASIELLNVLAAQITKFGSADAEDKRLVDARQGGFTNSPDFSAWTTFPFIETRYRSGIENVKAFQADVLAKKGGAHVNITNANIASILEAINARVLEVPRGNLTSRNRDVNWSQLDDDVFFAQGAAIPVRDILMVIKNSYGAKIIERGAMENLNQALGSLDGILAFHPEMVIRGDGDSLFADHRSKLARYYAEVSKRIADVADALKG